MTFEELILRVRSAWQEERDSEIRTLVTTGVGTSTTFPCTSLTETNDFYNGKEVFFPSLGQRRLITDWVFSTKTVTVEREFKSAIASGEAFLIGEKGFWSDVEILDWANDGQFDIVRNCTNVALWDSLGQLATLTIGVAGTASVPADFVRFARSHVLLDGVAAPLMREYGDFNETVFIGNRAYKQGGDILYRPTTAAAVTAEIIRRPADIGFDATGYDDIDLDKQFHDALADYVIMRGMLKLESKSADKYHKLYTDKLKAINATAA